MPRSSLSPSLFLTRQPQSYSSSVTWPCRVLSVSVFRRTRPVANWRVAFPPPTRIVPHFAFPHFWILSERSFSSDWYSAAFFTPLSSFNPASCHPAHADPLLLSLRVAKTCVISTFTRAPVLPREFGSQKANQIPHQRRSRVFITRWKGVEYPSETFTGILIIRR